MNNRAGLQTSFTRAGGIGSASTAKQPSAYANSELPHPWKQGILIRRPGCRLQFRFGQRSLSINCLRQGRAAHRKMGAYMSAVGEPSVDTTGANGRRIDPPFCTNCGQNWRDAVPQANGSTDAPTCNCEALVLLRSIAVEVVEDKTWW